MVGHDGRVRFGSPVEWSTGAKTVAIVGVALLLLGVGFASHARGVVEASYVCPVRDGDPGEVQYSFSDETFCTYDGTDLAAVPTRRGLDWFDPPASALVFGIGAVVVVVGAVLALRSVGRGARQ